MKKTLWKSLTILGVFFIFGSSVFAQFGGGTFTQTDHSQSMLTSLPNNFFIYCIPLTANYVGTLQSVAYYVDGQSAAPDSQLNIRTFISSDCTTGQQANYNASQHVAVGNNDLYTDIISGGNISIATSSSIQIRVDRTGGGFTNPLGTYGNGTIPYYVINLTLANFVPIASATSSSLFSGQDATTTLADLAAQCNQAGNIFAEAICIGFSYLFVPSNESIGQYSNLGNTLYEKFPFSIVTGISKVWTTLTASSTANAPVFPLDYASLGIGSTTPMGNILPSFDGFSSSTVTHFFPAGTFDALKLLASIALYLGLFADIFFTTRNMIRT